LDIFNMNTSLQPHIEFIDQEHITVTDPWTVETTVGTLSVRCGADSDGASIPPVINAIPGFNKFEGDTLPAALAHDMLYATELCTRAEADWVFYILLRANGVSWWRARTYYRMVRIFGGFTWKKHTMKTIVEARRYVTLTQ
jgi:Protein of unknown function (DUF1353)